MIFKCKKCGNERVFLTKIRIPIISTEITTAPYFTLECHKCDIHIKSKLKTDVIEKWNKLMKLIETKYTSNERFYSIEAEAQADCSCEDKSTGKLCIACKASYYYKIICKKIDNCWEDLEKGFKKQ